VGEILDKLPAIFAIAAIINDIQQNNIGQLFDIEYLLSLTATMRALLYEYSSSIEAFTVGDDRVFFPIACLQLIGKPSFGSCGFVQRQADSRNISCCVQNI